MSSARLECEREIFDVGTFSWLFSSMHGFILPYFTEIPLEGDSAQFSGVQRFEFETKIFPPAA